MADYLPSGCPGCGSCDLRLSQRTASKFLTRLLFLHPVRCLACGRRFWRFGFRPPAAASAAVRRSRAA